METVDRKALPILFPLDSLRAYCERWKVAELALFGSVLRPDFDDDSDLDVLISFDDSARWSVLEQVRMERELTAIVGRKVDLVPRKAIESSPN